MVKYMTKRKNKRIKLFVLLIIILVISFVVCDIYFAGSHFSNQVGQTFDLMFSNVIKSTKKYKNCMSGTYDEGNFSVNLNDKKNEIISLYSSLDANFMYTDLNSGYSFGQGENQESYAASVTKLPAVLYAYKQADDYKLDLNKELIYLDKYERGGSGVIQKSAVGTKYKLGLILEYAIRYSDNIAYEMLLDELGGRSKVKEYWSSLGYDIKYSDDFGSLSPSLGNGYIKEVYKYYLTGKENARKLVDDMKNSANSQYVKIGDVEVAHKYGEYVEGGGYYNDVSLNFTEYPFALSITSTLGYSDEMKNLFLKTHELSIEFNKMYHEEMENYCLEKSHILGS